MQKFKEAPRAWELTAAVELIWQQSTIYEPDQRDRFARAGAKLQ